MDGDLKKRKAAEDGRQQEEDEEAKMEEFFALVRSTRDIRERLIRSNSVPRESSDPNERKAKVWTPKFKPEDFADEGNPSGSSSPPPPVSDEGGHSEEDSRENKGGGKQPEDSHGLDLKLSL